MQRFEVQFPAIFIIFGSESKSRSKLATNQVASALGISTTFYWSKVLWERNFFPRVDPLPSGRRHSSGSEAPPKGSTLDKLIVDTRMVWLADHR